MKRFFKALVFLAYLWIVIWNFLDIDRRSHSVSDTVINFIPEAALLTVLLVLIIIVINDYDLIMHENHKS